MKTFLLLSCIFLTGSIHAVTPASREISTPEDVAEGSQQTQFEFDEERFRAHLQAWHNIKIKNVEYTHKFDIQIDDKEEDKIPRDCWSTPHGVRVPLTFFQSLLPQTRMAKKEDNEPEFASKRRQQFKKLLTELPKKLPHHNSFSKVHLEIMDRWDKVKDAMTAVAVGER